MRVVAVAVAVIVIVMRVVAVAVAVVVAVICAEGQRAGGASKDGGVQGTNSQGQVDNP